MNLDREYIAAKYERLEGIVSSLYDIENRLADTDINLEKASLLIDEIVTEIERTQRKLNSIE